MGGILPALATQAVAAFYSGVYVRTAVHKEPGGLVTTACKRLLQFHVSERMLISETWDSNLRMFASLSHELVA